MVSASPAPDLTGSRCRSGMGGLFSSYFGTGQNTAVVNPIVKGFAQKQVDFVDAVCEEKMRFPITSLRWKDDSVLISVSM